MKSLLVLFVLPCALCSSEVIKKDKRPCFAIILINVPYSSSDSWFKREVRQTDMGPFWANRGKKDPKHFHSKLYAEEPHWLYIRKDNESFDNDFDPFFTTRGKKYDKKPLLKKLMEQVGRRKDVKQYTPR